MLLRIKTILLSAVVCSFVFSGVVCGQSNIGIRGRRVEIDVTVRDSSGEILAVPANIRIYLNGTQCAEGATSSGRASFTISDIGKFTVVAEAAGYKQGQNEVNIAEPVTVQIEVSLRHEASPNFPLGAADNPALAPKAKAAFDKGIQALRDDKLEEAEKALTECIKLAPNNPHVLYLQGLLDLKKHEWTKAQAVLEKVTQMEPSSPRALAALGMALCDQKKYIEAIPPLEESLRLDPDAGWETHWCLAESYYHSERFEEALKVSEQAEAESNGQAPQVDLLVARALTAVGRYEDSAKVLRELLAHHGDGPEAVTARRFLDRLTADGKIQNQ
jgi:tetratricopeptide (TPR) repeat protein